MVTVSIPSSFFVRWQLRMTISTGFTLPISSPSPHLSANNVFLKNALLSVTMDGSGIFTSELVFTFELEFFLPLCDRCCFYCHLPCVNWGSQRWGAEKTEKQARVWLLSLTGEVAEVFQSPDVLWNSSCWTTSLASSLVILAILHTKRAVLGCWYPVYPLNHRCPFQCINSSRKNCFITLHPVELGEVHLWGWKQQRTGIQSSDSGTADAGKFQLLGAGISLALPVCVALHAPCP